MKKQHTALMAAKRPIPANFSKKCGHTAHMNKLDNFDLLILRELQKDCRRSSEQLAEIVALSPTAIQRRIKRLRDEQVIVAERATINPKALGRSLSLIVMVSFKIGRSDINAQFKQTMCETSQVLQCYAITGDYDFALTMSVKDMEEYEALTHSLFHSNEAIQKFQTMVVMETVKEGLQIPIDA
nr:Lrp/AsnC family transcriptional regulator [uncultured Undibacterium sp.]